jgi:hypothetical protein
MKSMSEETREEKRREEESYIYNIYNSTNQQDDIKILRSIYVSKLVWDSAKSFAHFLEDSLSVTVEKALMEYMKEHASDLPVTASFNLVPVLKQKDAMFEIEANMMTETLKRSYLPLKTNITNQSENRIKFYHTNLRKELPRAVKVARRSKNEELANLILEIHEFLKPKTEGCLLCSVCKIPGSQFDKEHLRTHLLTLYEEQQLPDACPYKRIEVKEGW